MSNISIQDYNVLDSIDVKNEKIKDFLRYKDNPNFFDLDTIEEIEQTRNIWAWCAFKLSFVDDNVKLSAREERFLALYFNDYILKIDANDLERQLKNIYLKYRISNKYSKNHILDKDLKVISNDTLKDGTRELAITLNAIIKEIIGNEVCLEVLETNDTSIKNVRYVSKSSKLMVEDRYLESKLIGFARNDYDPNYIFEIVKQLVSEIEISRLEDVKKHEISDKALVYTIEDYLYSKSIRKTKLGDAYASLYNNIIANKQITIDASKSAYKHLLKLKEICARNELSYINKRLDDYILELNESIENMPHYYSDAKYFDTNNLEVDGFSKLYSMYTKGLKAMPKSKLSAITKYFVLNGERLTLLDMELIKSNYSFKISRAKDEQRRSSLQKEYDSIKEVIDFIKKHSISYKIEEKILSCEDIIEILNDEEFINMILENYSEFEDMKYAVINSYNNLENLASSGSPSKVSNIRSRQCRLIHEINAINDIEVLIESKKSQLAEKFEFVNHNRDIVISKVANKDKLIAMLQELTGKGIFTVENLIDESVATGSPVIRNLNPGFKEFMEKALALRGTKEFKNQKSR